MKQHVRVTQGTKEGTIQIADGVLDFVCATLALEFEMVVNAGMNYRIHLNDPKPVAGDGPLLQAIKLLRDEYTRVVNLADQTAHDWNGMYVVDAAIRDAEEPEPMTDQVITAVLTDVDASQHKTVEARITVGSAGLFIGFGGYGEKTAAAGHGQPIGIELYYGHPRVIVWGDINDEDPTHIISLAEADESNRGRPNPSHIPVEMDTMNFTGSSLDSAELADQERQFDKFTPSIDVGAAIVFDSLGRVLLIHRRADVSNMYAGQWVLPGGKVDLNEKVEDAAVRELKEETSVVAYSTGRLEQSTLTPDGRHRRYWFVCRLDPESPLPENKEPAKHDAVQWFPVSALPVNMSEDDRSAILYVKGPITPGHPYAVISPESVSPRMLMTTLLAVHSIEAIEEELAKLTPEQRWEAANWAAACGLCASDYEDVVVPPKPAYLEPFKVATQAWEQPTDGT